MWLSLVVWSIPPLIKNHHKLKGKSKYYKKLVNEFWDSLYLANCGIPSLSQYLRLDVLQCAINDWALEEISPQNGPPKKN